MKLIKISALWCPSCLIMNDMIADIAMELNLDMEEYDYDFDEEIVKGYEPGRILPVIIIKEDNREIIRIIGEKNKNELLNLIKGSVK